MKNKRLAGNRTKLLQGLLVVGLVSAVATVSDAAPASTPAAAITPAPLSTPASNPRLLLPEIIYAVPGREANLYFDNVVLAPRGRVYLFDVTCNRGRQQEERWTWTPTAADSGDYALSLEVRDLDDNIVGQGSTLVRVAKADAGAGQPLSLLVIGDSLTAASVYTGELLQLFAGPGNPELKMLGTRKGAGTLEGHVHEGYGGWRFETFLSKYEADQTKIGNLGTSPFVFLQDDKPVFDFPRYVREDLNGVAPDVITIMLGINDVFGHKDDTLEEGISAILANADKLLSGIRAGAPNAVIGIIPPVPPSASQDSFGANYNSGQTRWQYRKNQHRLIERMLMHYGNRESENLFLIPAYVNLDTVHNYPQIEASANARAEVKIQRANNGVHPSPEGYRQIADSIYSWLKAR